MIVELIGDADAGAAALAVRVIIMCAVAGSGHSSSVKPSVSIHDVSYTAYAGSNNTTVVEIPLCQSWRFSCQWERLANFSVSPTLTIEVPSSRKSRQLQQPVEMNCEFGKSDCRPSTVIFPDDGWHGDSTVTPTCTEIASTLTCSLSLSTCSRHHVGDWACKSREQQQQQTEDRIQLVYFSLLTPADLHLTRASAASSSSSSSSDIVNNTDGSNSTHGGINNNNNNNNNNSSSSISIVTLDCFTTAVVTPPARLNFQLNGKLFGFNNATGGPTVLLLTDTRHSTLPIDRGNPAANLTDSAPDQDMGLNQQSLSSHRRISLLITPRHNGAVLTCVADQGLAEFRGSVSADIVLFSGSSPPLLRPRLPLLAVAVALVLASSIALPTNARDTPTP